MNTTIKVWAPKAKTVHLCYEQNELKMQPDTNGYWKTNIKVTKEPFKYAFKINKKGPFPDPVSQFQPDGVHGFSQLWIQDFNWTDSDFVQAPLSEAVIYELHVGTFTPQGTFEAIINKLDYLIDLGVTHIELMPVAAFPGARGWGYDGVDLYAPHHAYGNPNDFKNLVNVCHSKNIAIILDVVYNHLGPDGNYLDIFAPYFASRYGTPWGKAFNYDCHDCDEVREYIINNALMWFRDYHIDGLRLDAIDFIYDFSATHLLEEMQNQVKALSKEIGRNLYLIPESDLNDPQIINNKQQGGYNLDSQWLNDFHHTIHHMLTQETNRHCLDHINYDSAEDLNKCLNSAYVLDGRYSPFRRRKHGRPLDKVNYEQFIVFLQNHDQIGNRPLGERLCHLISHDSCMLAAAILFFSPFVPMIFQGEEWAASTPFFFFTDHQNPQLGIAIKNGRLKDFNVAKHIAPSVPDPQNAETFKKSCLKWEEINVPKHSQMLAWYKKLLKTRKKYITQIRNSKKEFMRIDNKDNLYRYSAGSITILLNFSDSSDSVLLDTTNYKIVLKNKTPSISDSQICLAPESVVMLEQI